MPGSREASTALASAKCDRRVCPFARAGFTTSIAISTPLCRKASPAPSRPSPSSRATFQAPAYEESYEHEHEHEHAARVRTAQGDASAVAMTIEITDAVAQLPEHAALAVDVDRDECASNDFNTESNGTAQLGTTCEP